MAILVLTVVHTLETVDDEEERLLLVATLGSKLVTIFKQRRDVVLLAGDEPVSESESLSDQLDLEETLLSSVEEDHGPLLSQAICQLEHHRGLA